MPSSDPAELATKTKEELISEIQRLGNDIENLSEVKKWGIVWPEQKQDVIKDWEEKLPILRVKDVWILKEVSNPMNILIQGDNYHALSVLNYTHLEKVDMIYIDPPYNTGGSMMYNNNFPSDDDLYTNSMFLSMLYHRLKIAVNLLKPDGIVCCTIDDKELLAVLGIFEKLHFDIIRIVSIEIKPEGRNQENYIMGSHEYAIFAHRTGSVPIGRRIMLRDFLEISEYKYTDSRGNSYREDTFYRRSSEETSADDTRKYPIYANPNSAAEDDSNKLLELSLEKKEGWEEIWPQDDDGNSKKYGSVKMLERLLQSGKQNPKDPELFARKKSKAGKWKVYRKIYRKFFHIPTATWTHKDYSPQSYGRAFVENILNADAKTKKRKFSNPKSIFAVYDCIDLFLPENGTVLDFFAGSGTTAHATQMLNMRDSELEWAFVGKYGKQYHTDEKFLQFDAVQFCSFDPKNKDDSDLTKEELSKKWREWRIQQGKRRFIVCTNNELPNPENKKDTPFNKWRKGKNFEDLTQKQQEYELDHPNGICRWVTFPRLQQLTKGFPASEDVALKVSFPITSLAQTYEFTKSEKLSTIDKNLFKKEDEKGNKLKPPKKAKFVPDIDYWMFNITSKSNLKSVAKKFFVHALPFDMIYYQTDFIPASRSFSMSHVLVKNAVQLYCMKEDCFVEPTFSNEYIFTNKDETKTLIIVFSYEEIPSIIKYVKTMKGKQPQHEIVIYRLTTDSNDGLEDFEEVTGMATIKTTPRDIYTTYSDIEGEYTDG